jgi:hypothetical protein
MLVMGVPLHTVCASVPAADVRLSVAEPVIAIVPVRETGAQAPVVVTVYVPPAVGEPVMVTPDAVGVLVNPAGSPVTVTPVADPP